MKSLKRQAASKARHSEQWQGDSTRSLYGDEKLSCGFRVPVIIVKVRAAYYLTFMSMSGLRGGAELNQEGQCPESKMICSTRRKRHADEDLLNYQRTFEAERGTSGLLCCCLGSWLSCF